MVHGDFNYDSCWWILKINITHVQCNWILICSITITVKKFQIQLQLHHSPPPYTHYLTLLTLPIHSPPDVTHHPIHSPHDVTHSPCHSPPPCIHSLPNTTHYSHTLTPWCHSQPLYTHPQSSLTTWHHSLPHILTTWHHLPPPYIHHLT